MPNIKDVSTVNAIAEEFCGNGRNKLETLKIIGYKPSYYNTRGIGVVYSNVRVKVAIAKIDDENSAKVEHTREIAIKKLYEDYARLESQADKGNIMAINARTAIQRELNCINGLQQQVSINRDEKQAPKLTEAEQAELRKASIKLARMSQSA